MSGTNGFVCLLSLWYLWPCGHLSHLCLFHGHWHLRRCYWPKGTNILNTKCCPHPRLRGSHSLLRNHGLIRPHVGDMTCLIKTLSRLHSELRIHRIQCTGFLLQCTCDQRSWCRLSPWTGLRLLYSSLHDIIDILQIILSRLFIIQIFCHGRRQIRPESLDSPGGTHFKVCNLSFTVHYKSQSRCLTSSCTECMCNMLPE